MQPLGNPTPVDLFRVISHLHPRNIEFIRREKECQLSISSFSHFSFRIKGSRPPLYRSVFPAPIPIISTLNLLTTHPPLAHTPLMAELILFSREPVAEILLFSREPQASANSKQ